MSARGRHILILSSWYPTRLNPHLGNFVQRQAQFLSENQRVTVIHAVPDPTVKRTEIVTNHAANLSEFIAYFPYHKWRFIRFLREYFVVKKLLLQIEQPDIIHAHVCLPKGYLFLRAKRLLKRPLIITEHGSYFESTNQSKWNWRMRSLLKRIEANTSQFIAVSDVLKEDMEQMLTSTKIEVIPNAINTELFVPAIATNDTIHFLHVSTLDEKIKNVSGILEAFHHFVSNGNSTALLTIVSDEPYEELKQTCGRLYPGLPTRFAGPLTEKEIVPFFQRCSALLMNSKYETFSIVIAEAWSCGKPVISTPVGIARNLPTHLGVSVEIGNVESLVRAMEEFAIRRDEFDTHLIRQQALSMDTTRVSILLNQVYERYTN